MGARLAYLPFRLRTPAADPSGTWRVAKPTLRPLLQIVNGDVQLCMQSNSERHSLAEAWCSKGCQAARLLLRLSCSLSSPRRPSSTESEQGRSESLTGKLQRPAPLIVPGGRCKQCTACTDLPEAQ